MKITRLREWREAMGRTQAELSQRSGVSEHTISGVERGASLRVSTAKKLADALGLEVTDLMDRPPALSYAGKAEDPASGPSRSEAYEEGDVIANFYYDEMSHDEAVKEALAVVKASQDRLPAGTVAGIDLTDEGIEVVVHPRTTKRLRGRRSPRGTRRVI